MSRVALLVPLFAALACGGGGSRSTGTPLDTATPFDAPRGVWTWIDVPGTSCSDGSPTGFAVNPGDTTADVLFFMDGGGACWDYPTCFLSRTATPGPFGATQFQARASLFPNTFFDRGYASNPFRTWTWVFVPYCTGDLHSGDAVRDYRLFAGLPARRWVHAGRVNVAADVAHLAPELPALARLVVSGASAGGFGSLLQYDAIRKAWPARAAFLVDDSGPPLEGDALLPPLRAVWRSSWNLDPALDPVCPACKDDLSAIVPALAARYPGDRFALLSSLQDQVIGAFTLLPGPVFELALRVMVHDRFDPLPAAHAFLVPGNAHALDLAPGQYAAGGVPLPTWIGQMVESDPAWRSVGP
jgi:hypothetical protein